ncbi:MAG: TonB-dependent receptor [Chloroflexia bacterium]|nr:TonB-dependent receptor [Chloroflexia bacterium]
MTDLDIISNGVISESSVTNNNRDGYWRFGSINPYYSFEIDSLGQKLDVDLNYIQYSSKDKNYLVERALGNEAPEAENRMYQPGTTKITVAQIDYTYPFSKHLKFQIGAKYSYADLDNDYQSDELINGIWERNEQSNHYLFDEVIYAGYGKLSFNKSKWSGTLGLRYEDSQSNGKSVGVDSVLSRRIQQFFPSGSISREITKDIKGILAYSYRLERPRYSSLNPFRYNLDAYTYEEGNPELRAEFTHSTKFSLTYQNQPFFNVEYKLTKDPITMVYGQNEETGEAFRGDENLDMKNEFNVSLYFPLDFIPKISGYGGIIVNNQYFDTKYLDLNL